MKKLTILTITLLFFGTMYSQNVLWEHVYANYLVLGKMIAMDSQGDIITVANAGSTTGANEYLYTQKVSPQGNLIWKDSISTNLANNYHSATWVGIDSNDDIVVLGYQFQLSGQNEIPNALKVIKYDTNGNVVYNNTIDGVFNSGSISGMGRRNWGALDENNNLYVASAGITATMNDAGYVLLKLDTNGNLIWERVKTFSNVHSLRGMDYNNGVIALLGKTTISDFNNESAAWDENGNLLWFSSNSNTDQTWGTDIKVDAEGNTYTLVQKYVQATDLYGMALTKRGTDGVVDFEETYDFDYDVTSGRLALLPNGNVVVTATNWTVGGNGKLEVMQVSSTDGAIVNASSHALPQVTNWVFDIKVSAQGNYFVAGNSNNNGGAPSAMFLFAFSSNVGYEWDTLYNNEGVEPRAIVLDAEENIYAVIHNKYTIVKFGSEIILDTPGFNENTNIQIYPNPFKTMVNISLGDATEMEGLSIHNLNGQKVYEQTGYSDTLNLATLQSGVYLMVVTMNDGSAMVKKIVKN